MLDQYFKKYLAEFIGTFALVFCGTGAIVINDISGGSVTHVGIAITFGLIVMAMIYSFGHISGAHINPAVSIAFAMTDRYDHRLLLPYITVQILGALSASLILSLLFAEHQTLGATVPAGSAAQTFILEVLLTYFLMIVILFVSQHQDASIMTGIAVGATVLLEAMFAGPVTGASMNPARSIGPAVISGDLKFLWIYIAAPILGAVLGSLTWLVLKDDA